MLNFDFENDNGLSFNSLNDFNIWLPSKCNIPRAERRIKVDEIPKINGLVTKDLKTYKEIILKQPCEILQEDLINTNLEELYNWLNGQSGILKLSFYPNRYFIVYYIDPFEITESDHVVNEFTLNFYCYPYKFGDVITETIEHLSSKTINVLGNQPTPAIVTITVSIDTISLTLNGFGDEPIRLNNLKANKPVVIDGEACTVLENSINKFSDTDFWEFPSLQPGANTITVSSANCTININYKPNYI
jgi:phage-related protein